MNRKNMGIILIVLGAILLISGVVMVYLSVNFGQESHEATTLEQNLSSNSATVVNENEYRYIDPERTSDGDNTESVLNQQESVQTYAEVSDGDSKAKGNAFEDFVVNLLEDWRLKLLDRTQDAVSTAGVVAESCKNPDLHIQQKRGNGEIDYYIECKYRSNWNNGKVAFKDWQINRYRQFQRDSHRKVLIALGVGGTPSAPETLMIVPLDSVKDNSIGQIKTEYVIAPTPSALVDYINSYFTKVFAKAKQNSK